MTTSSTTPRPTTRRSRRPPLAARRFGYVVAVAVNAAMLYAVNRWPGWEELSFLTSDTELVLGLVNASIVVNLVVNLVYLARDPVWLRAVGETLSTVVGLVAMVRIWDVFPFDFADSGFDWAVLVRVLLVVGIVGSCIGIVTNLLVLVRSLTGDAER